MIDLAELVSKWRKDPSSSLAHINTELDKAAHVIVHIATGDQLEDIEQKLYWTCKSVSQFHGCAAVHHVMTEIKDDEGLCHVPLNEVKESIEERQKLIKTAREWLELAAKVEKNRSG